jgi:hypothetical protein
MLTNLQHGVMAYSLFFLSVMFSGPVGAETGNDLHRMSGFEVRPVHLSEPRLYTFEPDASYHDELLQEIRLFKALDSLMQELKLELQLEEKKKREEKPAEQPAEFVDPPVDHPTLQLEFEIKPGPIQ